MLVWHTKRRKHEHMTITVVIAHGNVDRQQHVETATTAVSPNGDNESLCLQGFKHLALKKLLHIPCVCGVQ